MAAPTMLPDIESAMEYAQYVLACSDQCPSTFVKPSGTTSTSKSKSIHQKLLDLYIEESARQPEDSEWAYNSNLLPKLVKREKLNTMILSLFPGNEGYTITLPSRNNAESETMKLPYEESEILDYIDSAQLPPFLLDLLEKAQVNLFYSGCIIVEVRDYRRSTVGSYDSHYVLLRPSSQSLLRDITAMSCDGHSWTQDDLLHLESELLLATEEPLCLDPSPAVMYIENALQYQHKFLNDPALKRSVKKYTQVAANRKRKLAQSVAPEKMRLYDFISKKKGKTTNSSLSKTRMIVDSFKQTSDPVLSRPETVDVKKYAKPTEAPNTSGMIFVEEHTMERDPNQDHHMMAQITIYQPQLGDRYYGKFYLDHDYGQTRSGKEGRRCRFVIGSRQCVDRYLQQFKDLFTEEGKLQMKITIRKANEPTPTITYTQGLASAPVLPPSATPTTISLNTAQAALMKQVAFNQQAAVKAEIGTPGAAVAGLASKRNFPIQLSLSLSPAVANLPTCQASSGIPSTLSTQFLAASISTASMVAGQRLKTPVPSQHRPASSSPLSSPVAPPKASTPQQAGASIPLIALPKASTPTLTPPPNSRTPTPTLAGTRRSSNDLSQQIAAGVGNQQTLQQQQNLTNFIQGLTSGTVVAGTDNQSVGLANQQQQQQQSQQAAGNTSGLTNLSISNLGQLSSNLNLQGLAGLSGVNIANLSGLQQMQVSLAQIAVPITMINANANLLQAQSGILANSSASSGSSTATLVTMVTALPASSTNTTTTTTVTGSSQVTVSTGSNMLSFPVGLSGLTQLMPVTSKGQAGQSIRPTAMPLLQLQGQQGIQLLSLQQRGQVKQGTSSANTAQGITRLAQAGTTTVPLSTVLAGPQMTALGVANKPVGGQGGNSAAITAHQLIQLTGGQGASLGQAAAAGGSQQRAAHITFGKGQQGLQFHSLQLKQGGATLPTSGQQQQGSSSSSATGSGKAKGGNRNMTNLYKS